MLVSRSLFDTEHRNLFDCIEQRLHYKRPLNISHHSCQRAQRPRYGQVTPSIPGSTPEYEFR
jgi:hypothetical protein